MAGSGALSLHVDPGSDHDVAFLGIPWHSLAFLGVLTRTHRFM